MKSITSLSEISKDGKAFLFITGCAWADQARPMIEAFEEENPGILGYTAEVNASPEINTWANKTSPTFGLFENGICFNKFTSGTTNLEEFTRAWYENDTGILDIILSDIDNVIKKYIKPAYLFISSANESCGDCAEMRTMMEQLMKDNICQVFEIPNSPDVRAKLGLTPTPVDMPIIAMFNRGVQSKVFCYGKKGPKMFAYQLSLMALDIKDQTSCKKG